MSSMNQGENSVKKEKYNVATQHPQKKQKLLSAGKLVIEPRKKARPSVTEVTVIDGPA